MKGRKNPTGARFDKSMQKPFDYQAENSDLGISPQGPKETIYSQVQTTPVIRTNRREKKNSAKKQLDKKTQKNPPEKIQGDDHWNRERLIPPLWNPPAA
ncbi:MAG: hypothetical protein ACLUDH_02175 [Faecalispora sporosphaeroides]|uniref:hypothetical protein n=1 Tax=Faecalispora sporosphaeroides TaxID=1549 RepID=UPI0039924213